MSLDQIAYAALCQLEFDGKTVDFDDFTPDEIVQAEAVDSAIGTGYINKVKKYGFKMSAKRPVTGFSFDISATVGGTVTVVYEDNSRDIYMGVKCTKETKGKIDGKSALMHSFEFIARDLKHTA